MTAFKDWLTSLATKSTPVDADELYLRDSSGTPSSKKVTWADLKATIRTTLTTYFDGLYANIANESVRLTADQTWYVRKDGSDSNTGLTNTAGGAFLTIQKALNVAILVKPGPWQMIIQVGDGTYAEWLYPQQFDGWNILKVQGNAADSSAVVFEGVSLYEKNCAVSFQYMTLGGGEIRGSSLYLLNCTFGYVYSSQFGSISLNDCIWAPPGNTSMITLDASYCGAYNTTVPPNTALGAYNLYALTAGSTLEQWGTFTATGLTGSPFTARLNSSISTTVAIPGTLPGVKTAGSEVNEVPGWRDIIGQIEVRGTGAADPTFAVYTGTAMRQYQFSATVMQEVFIVFHIPHDYVPGTDIFLHIHWSNAAATPNTGNVRWGFDYAFAKGFDQAAFPAFTTITVTQACPATRYQHMIAETAAISIPALEVDGLVLVRAYRDAANAGDTCTDAVFGHTADIHYQSSNMATKGKAPNFYL